MWERIRGGLAAVGAVLLALLAGVAVGRRARRPLGREVDLELARTEEAARHAGEVLAEEEQAAESRQERARRLDERLRRLPGAPLIVLLTIGLTLIAPAALAQAPAPHDLPSDYEALVDLYLEAVQIAAEYRELYQQAEASNARLIAELEALRAEVQRLTQVVERQQQLIERQQGAIMSLLRGVRVSAGVSLRSLDPLALAPWVAVAYEW